MLAPERRGEFAMLARLENEKRSSAAMSRVP